MAVLPTTRGPRTPRPSAPVATISADAMAAPAREMERLGATVRDAGIFLQDRADTAAAKERDAFASEEIRKLLYDPENGYLHQEGANAVDRYSAVGQALEEIKAKAMDGLSPGARRKMESQLQSRLDSALQKVDIHAESGHRTWINSASEARINSAYQDSLMGGEEMKAALGVIQSEYEGIAEREGWPKEKLDAEIAKATSSVYKTRAQRLATFDPVQALEYFNEVKGDMLPSDAATLETTLVPAAKEYKGRTAGATAFSGMPAYDHQTRIEFSMGPARPYRPNKPVLDVVGMAAQDTFGEGARVVVVSGQEGDNPQHGSNRHKTGHAADIAIYRPDGSRVLATDTEMAQFARAAAARGATGIGFGAEYMSGSHVHIDLVEPGPGQANTWASGGKAMRDELVGIMNGNGLQGLLEIPDPIERKAALAEYELRASVAETQSIAERRKAELSAFAHVEAGGTVDTLPFETRVALGTSGASALRSYEAKLKSGDDTTDPETYVMLRQMQYNDPEGFRRLNMVEFSDRLSTTDWKSLADAQAKPHDPEDGVAVATLMSEASRYLAGAGIDPTPKPGSDEATRVSAFTMRLTKWQQGFIEREGRKPTAVERAERIQQELAPVVIDPSGLMNKTEGFAFDTGGDPDEVLDATASVEINNVLVPREVKNDIIETLKARGITPTRQAFTDLYTEWMNGNWTPQD